MLPIVRARALAALAVFMVLLACVDAPKYSLQAYTNATELKAKSLALLEKGHQPFSRHRAEAEKLMLDISVAYEFAAGIKNNEEARDMWRLIRDPEENLMGGFVKHWSQKSPGGVGKVFVGEFRNEVIFGFDRLICLEANKRATADCPPPR